MFITENEGNKKEYKLIGLVIAGIQDEYVQSITKAVGREAIKRGYKVMMFATYNDMFYDTQFVKGESSIFKLINNRLLDGLVLLPESIKKDEIWQSVLADAMATGLPCVCIDRNVEGCSSIVFDYSGAFEEIVRHIVEGHGCRRINFIAGIKGNSFSEERVECYKRVLKENGIPFEPERLGYGDFWDVPTAKVMKDFLESDLPRPEAIICSNDVEAITACRILKSRGVKVPKDVIVTGFDGIELERYTVPRLTTAAPDINKMCVAAANALEAGLNGQPMPDVVSIPFKARFSQSCGCREIYEGELSENVMELYNRIEAANGHEKHMFAYSFHTVDSMKLDDMTDIMFKYGDSHMWCCLNLDFVEDNYALPHYNTFFTEKMLMLMHNDENTVERNIEFDARELLPNMGRVLEENDILMFLPMHFQDEVMGYLAVSINTENFNFRNTHRFINNTNSIFENLKNRIRLQKAYAELNDLHLHDAMTGIFNRHGFNKRAEELREAYGRSKKYLLFSADLDRLKYINDTFGHLAGDKAIMAAAKAITAYGGDDVVCARFGGDEFTVLAACDDAEKFEKSYLDAVRESLAQFNAGHEFDFEVHISFGSQELEDPDRDSLLAALKLADRKMYECKHIHHAERKI